MNKELKYRTLRRTEGSVCRTNFKILDEEVEKVQPEPEHDWQQKSLTISFIILTYSGMVDSV